MKEYFQHFAGYLKISLTPIVILTLRMVEPGHSPLNQKFFGTQVCNAAYKHLPQSPSPTRRMQRLPKCLENQLVTVSVFLFPIVLSALSWFCSSRRIDTIFHFYLYHYLIIHLLKSTFEWFLFYIVSNQICLILPVIL